MSISKQGNICQIDHDNRKRFIKNQTHVLNSLSCAFTKAGSFKEALKAARRAISLQPQFGYYWTSFGEALEAMGAIKGAIRIYHKALEIDPNERYAIEYLQRLGES
ncbi:MAG TPA: hypothetical protein VKM55_24360 [Candidatus Lokiarchaeia archaeon]|nr:hypothetical protein [Candidatus Lokiarchaeia archaeon]